MSRPSRKQRTICTSNLALVNGTTPFTGSIAPEQLVPVGPESDGVFMERHAAALLNRLMGDIRGWEQIAAVSGWRSEEEQRNIWNESLAANGEAYTKQFVAVPGHSEHHTGLAIDLGLRQEALDLICPDFPYTGICQTFRTRAAQYGFIQRYPSGKEHITGIAHEPWHFRYVGIPHAEIISMRGITLEEYLDILRQHAAGHKPFVFKTAAYDFVISYLSAEHPTPDISEGSMPSLISSDNRGGLIITAWKDKEV